MKKLILLFIMVITMTTSVISEKRDVPMQIHNGGRQSQNLKEDRSPINLPVTVHYDYETNILEVWCDNDNIQAEVYVYDESGDVVEAYSPCMNVTITLISSGSHSILIVGDGWEGEGEI